MSNSKTQPTKIKCNGKPVPNCEVKVKETDDWELRTFNEVDGYVYTYHKGYWWPQWKSGKYYQIRLIAPKGQDWQSFEDCSTIFNKGKQDD